MEIKACPIKDMGVYTNRMQKAVLDKMFFMDKVFYPFSDVIDFGCANGEHFQLHYCSEKYKISEKLLLIPAHCCSTVNLHDKIYLVEGDAVKDRIPVTARGIGK